MKPKYFKKFFQKTKICPYTDAKEKVVSDWKTTKTDQDVETKGAENILKNPQGAAKMKIKKKTTFLSTKKNCLHSNIQEQCF